MCSRHNGMHFFDIWTSKSGPNPSFFEHFDLKMCFAPQRHALFRHLNLQKVVRTPGVFNILTSKCASRHNGVHFFDISTAKSGPDLMCLYILTWKCASRHNGVHFFDISTAKSGPHLVCFCAFWLGNVLRATTACNFLSLIWPASSAPAAFASLLFDPPEPQIIGKTQCVATFLPFLASASSFFLLFLFYSSFFESFSSLCLFPALLFICPYCRKFDF